MTVAALPRHQFTPGVRERDKCDFNYPTGGCTLSERQHDIGMMQDPNDWPAWPLLPLKRHTPDDPLDCGFIAELVMDVAIEPVVYHGLIFEAAEVMRDESRWLRYATWDELYDAGWRVD